MDKEQKEPDFDKLRFVRVFTPVHVPKYLIEQIKDRDYDVDDWYEYLEIISLREGKNGPELNPLSMLYVIVDESNKVVGMLWCDVEVLSKSLVVQIFSIDKDYWHKGKAAKLAADKVKEIAKECKFNRVLWITSYPKFYEYYGFRKSKTVLMEAEMNKEGEKNVWRNKRKCKTNGRGRTAAAGTETISSGDSKKAGPTSSVDDESVSAAV